MKTCLQDKKTISIHVAIMLVVALVFFYCGMKYSQSQSPARGQFAMGQFNGQGIPGGAAGARTARNFGGAINGSIIAVDAQSVTVKDRNGGAKIIFLAASSEITKSVAGTAADLVIGQNIMAMGTPNSDGSITAQTISVRPAGAAGAMPTGFGGGQGQRPIGQ